MSLSRAARIILVGAPGVGKGTQSERLLKRFPQLSSISSGDLLRDNVRRRTPLGLEAEKTMKAGELVPDSTILRLILAELKSRNWITPISSSRPPSNANMDDGHALNTSNQDPNAMPSSTSAVSATSSSLSSTSSASSADDDQASKTSSQDPNQMPSSTSNTTSTSSSPSSASPSPSPQNEEYSYSDTPASSFILDGFPRTAAQASSLSDLIPINLVISIRTPHSIILDRICNRWVHEPSGRVYNTTFNAPKVDGRDDITGEALTRRPDDDPETWRNRLRKFEETSAPLLDFYDRKSLLWTVEGNSSDEISPKIFEEFEKRFG